MIAYSKLNTFFKPTLSIDKRGKGCVILNKTIIRLGFCLLIVFSTNTFSQTFTQELDKDSIKIGDPVTLILKLTTTQNKKYIWPTFFKGDSLPNGFEIIEVFDKQQSNNNKGLVTQQLTITSFEPGNHTLEPFVLQDTAEVLTSNVVDVYVSLLSVDTTQAIRDIKPIKEANLTFKDKWYRFLNWLKKNWYWVLLGAIVLGFVLWFLFFRKKKQENTVNEAPVVAKKIVPAHTVALNELNRLANEKPWVNGDFKLYSTQLTDVIRAYIFGRYQISTKEKTSSQILNELENKTISDSLKEKLRGLLTLSDLVKFAKQEPTHEQSEKILQDAIDFVKQTTPKQE